MPTVEENRAHWKTYDWSEGGEEWSELWGGTESQWQASIRPRLRRFLPTGRVLEIGCGCGRLSGYLRTECDSLIGVDLAEGCVATARERFAADPLVSFEVTDGSSLPGIADASIDLAFSFDSLVHAEMDVVRSYLAELDRVLTPDGAAFLHHSNLASVLASAEDPVENPHWRARSMSAGRMIELCLETRGLRVSRQEVVNWGGFDLTDCFSVIVRCPPGEESPQLVRRENGEFMQEAVLQGAISELYEEGWG